MQNTSATYKEIVAGTHWFETKLVIGDEFYLIDEHTDYIAFTMILIPAVTAETCSKRSRPHTICSPTINQWSGAV